MAGGRTVPDGAVVDEVEALRVLFEHSPVPQFVADVRGALLLANPAYAALVGVPVEEVIGSVPADVTHPEDLPVLIREGRRLLAGEVDVISLELRVRCADGTYRWCLATCSSAPTAAGVQLVVCQLLDVDDRAGRRRTWPRARSRCNDSPRSRRPPLTSSGWWTATAG